MRKDVSSEEPKALSRGQSGRERDPGTQLADVPAQDGQEFRPALGGPNFKFGETDDGADYRTGKPGVFLLKFVLDELQLVVRPLSLVFHKLAIPCIMESLLHKLCRVELHAACPLLTQTAVGDDGNDLRDQARNSPVFRAPLQYLGQHGLKAHPATDLGQECLPSRLGRNCFFYEPHHHMDDGIAKALVAFSEFGFDDQQFTIGPLTR